MSIPVISNLKKSKQFMNSCNLLNSTSISTIWRARDVTGYLPLYSTSINFFMKQSFPVFMGRFNNFNSKILVYNKESIAN